MGVAHSTVDACGLCHVRPEKDLFKRSHEHVLPTCNSSPFSPPNSSPFSPLCARGCAYRESKEEDIVMEQGFAPLYDLTLRDMTTKQLLAIRRELATRSRSLTSVENTAEQRHIVADLRSVQSILPTILFDDLEAQAVVRGGLTSTARQVLESEAIFHSLQQPSISCADAARMTRLENTISKGCPVRAVVRDEHVTSASKQPFALLLVQRTERISDSFTVIDFKLLCECGSSLRAD